MSNRSSVISGQPSSRVGTSRIPPAIRSMGKRRVIASSPVDRVKGEFAEMRGFSPTLAQAARLFDLSTDECDRVMRSLVQDGSISRGDDGRYRLR